MSLKMKDDLVAQVAHLLAGGKSKIGLQSILEEVEVITSGTEQMKFVDALSFWMYAALRTDFEAEKVLSAEEIAWRNVCKIIEEQLKSLETKDGTPINLDKMRNQVQLLRRLSTQATLKDLPEMALDFEEKLVKFEAYAIAHLDKGNSDYCKYFELLGDRIKNSKQPEEKVKLANEMQKLNETYEEALIKHLRRLQDDIGNDLYMLQRSSSNLEDEILRTVFEKWCELSRRVYLNLVMASNCVRIDYEFNCEYAKGIIEQKGSTDKDSSQLTKLLKDYVVMSTVAHEKHAETQKLNKERKNILERIFPQKEQEKEPVQQSNTKLDFDIGRFLKTILSMYVVAALFGMFVMKNNDASAALGLFAPIYALFAGGFIPALVIGFIVYCSWTMWDHRNKP